jgi:hypothetical protein
MVRSLAVAIAALAVALAAGCEPTVIVGSRFCATSPDAGPDVDATAPIETPWSTSFEDGFCDYAAPRGFCFGTGTTSFTRVTSPVRSGRYAAAFFVQSDVDGGSQVRCVQEGTFPAAAYYGAWYYIPSPAQNPNNNNWNLFFFQGGDAGGALGKLWDVSLFNSKDGGLHPTIRNYFPSPSLATADGPPITLDQWFHLEVYFKRAADSSGELSLWQDGEMVVHFTGVPTDDTNWGQWYVGNLATGLVPAASTVYVDDVTISAAP